MVDLGKIRKRGHKFHVSVPKKYFVLESSSTEPPFYGDVVNVMDNVYVRVR